MCRTSLFSSDMTIISYFNITFIINIITNLTFSRAFKIFIIFFSHHKFFVKIIFHNISITLTLFDHIINKITNSFFTLVRLKRFTKLIINTYYFITITASNILLIFVCIRSFAFHYLLALKYFQNLHKL